jgi:hypothetical protein
MKRLLKYNLFALLLVATLSEISAQVELYKRIEQEFKVDAGKLLDIKSSFGKIHVNNWDKNEFKVVIDIRAESSTDARAQKLLDRIDINITENNNSVIFQTILDGSNSKGSEEFEVVYTVNMPTINPLKIKHSFGDVFLDNRQGLTQTDVSYGAGTINAEVQFSGFTIEKLNESIVMNSKYVSGFEINSLSSKFSLVDLNGDFGSFKIRLENNVKANFEGYFSFADLKNSGVDIDFNYSVKENNKSEYKGKINGGDPSKIIRVKSSYGDCRLFY